MVHPQSGHLLITLFITIFVVMNMDLCICSGGSNNTSGHGVCKEAEKQALLCFKKALQLPYSHHQLSSWVDGNGSDCCSSWEGVVCDQVSGHVIELHPAAPFDLYFDLHDSFVPKGKLSSCLLELKQLRHLDLGHGLEFYLKPSKIPIFIGSLAKLQYLDLSYMEFQGIIPHQLGNLSSLHTLRLNGRSLKADSLDWVSSLRKLEVFDLESVDLSMAHNWLEVINTLPSLRELNFRGCDLPPNKSSHLLHHHNNSSSLQVLDLSQIEFNSVIPRWIFNLNNLKSLHLSLCRFLGPLPDSPWNLTSLTILDISQNNLNGSLPTHLFGLGHLKYLYMGSNEFQNPLPSDDDPHWNLTSLIHLGASRYHLASRNNGFMSQHIPNWIYHCINLEYLDLSRNQLQGTILSSISNLISLGYLSLSGNMLTGKIPEQIGKLNKLYFLDISGNKFYGPLLDDSFGSLFPMMESLDVSDNMLEGIVTESHFFNLSMLRDLYASRNRLTLNVGPNWTPPFQLEVLELSCWNLDPYFPTWLQSQRQLEVLDISHTGIEDEIPSWFWNLSSDIIQVNLSHNQLQGEIQTISFPTTSEGRGVLVYLGSNQFRGPLPRISANITELDLSNNSFSGDVSEFLCQPLNVSNDLEILHLGMNGLSGEIPNCWTHWLQLEVINMNGNKLVGSIPDSIGLLNQLQSLDLHKNLLSGHMPPSLQNCSLLFQVDLGENGFTGNIPRWLGTSLSNLAILRLRLNNFYGELPLEFCHLTSLHILDLSNNNIFGAIPRCLQNLTAMVNGKDIQDVDDTFMMRMTYSFVDRFSESALVTTKGHEYEYNDFILRLFASMDLSSNNFTGSIPIELSNLVALRSLNLSRNNLAGSIPKEMGNMKSLESLDLSDNHLSGEIPSTFSSLYSLGVLNLSYNNLSGKVPSGTQLQSFNASSYIGNRLCGPPIPLNCGVDNDGETPNDDENRGDDDDDGSEVDWFYVSMAVGFAVGLWAVCASLILVTSWRIAYFQFLDKLLNSCFRR